MTKNIRGDHMLEDKGTCHVKSERMGEILEDLEIIDARKDKLYADIVTLDARKCNLIMEYEILAGKL